ncbi:Uncharacterised protein [Vibrio cholerae]|nr:Uncharacterised protein [Vibrio cholerae]
MAAIAKFIVIPNIQNTTAILCNRCCGIDHARIT